MGWWDKHKNLHGPFAYFTESGDSGGGEVERTVRRMKQDSKTGPHIQVCSFTTVDKGSARGLEAADFMAWHWNKYYIDKLRLGKRMNPRKDFAAFVEASEKKIDSMFLTEQKLRYFLELREIDE